MLNKFLEFMKLVKSIRFNLYFISYLIMNVAILFLIMDIDKFVFVEVSDFLSPLGEKNLISDFTLELLKLEENTTNLSLINLLILTNVLALVLFLINPLLILPVTGFYFQALFRITWNFYNDNFNLMNYKGIIVQKFVSMKEKKDLFEEYLNELPGVPKNADFNDVAHKIKTTNDPEKLKKIFDEYLEKLDANNYLAESLSQKNGIISVLVTYVHDHPYLVIGGLTVVVGVVIDFYTVNLIRKSLIALAALFKTTPDHFSDQQKANEATIENLRSEKDLVESLTKVVAKDSQAIVELRGSVNELRIANKNIIEANETAITLIDKLKNSVKNLKIKTDGINEALDLIKEKIS